MFVFIITEFDAAIHVPKKMNIPINFHDRRMRRTNRRPGEFSRFAETEIYARTFPKMHAGNNESGSFPGLYAGRVLIFTSNPMPCKKNSNFKPGLVGKSA